MAAITTLAAVGGLALTAAGTASSISGARSTQKAQEQGIAAQQEGEVARKKAMEIDASRRRREIIRQSMIARSHALATGVNQGAAGKGGSAMPGSFGQIMGESNFALAGVDSQLQLGRDLFASNVNLLNARRAGASAETTTSMGRGLSSLGGTALGNIGAIDRIGGTVSGWMGSSPSGSVMTSFGGNKYK